MNPARFAVRFWAGVGAFIVVCGIIVGGWQAGWWFAAQNANKQYQVTQNSQAYQDTMTTQISNALANLTDEDVQVASAQRAHDTGMVGQVRVEEAAQANKACQLGQHLTQTTVDTLPASEVTWFQRNCNNGVVAPTSPYFISTPGAPALP